MAISSTLILAILFAFVIAFIFSMFGQGGGSVFSPLLLLLGFTALISTSTSLVLNLITSLSAGYIFYRMKMIDYKISLIFAPGISLGAFAGGALAKSFNTTFLMWLFVAFLVLVGARMLYSYWEKQKTDVEPQKPFTAGWVALIAIVGLAVLIGGNLGARLSMKINTKMIKAGLGLIMFALAAQLVIKLLA